MFWKIFGLQKQHAGELIHAEEHSKQDEGEDVAQTTYCIRQRNNTWTDCCLDDDSGCEEEI